MNPKLQPLIDLQRLDLKIAELRDQQRKLPKSLEAAEVSFREASRTMSDAKTALELRGKERRDRERELEMQEGQIDKLRSRLTELKTNKEYQAHLFEIEMANKRKREIEDAILVLMEQVETGQRELKEAQGRAAEAERVVQQEKARLSALSEGLNKELVQLETKLKELTAMVDPGLFDRYTKLKLSRKDLALAPVRNGICSGCRLQLPPQLVAEVKRSDEMHSCSYCYRILYWEGDPASVSAQ